MTSTEEVSPSHLRKVSVETFKNQCLQRLRDYAADDEVSQFRPLDSANFGPRLPEEVCFRPLYFATYNPVFLFTDRETRTRMWRIRNLVLVSSGTPNVDPTYGFVESPDVVSTFFARYDSLPVELKITLNSTLENSPDVRAVVYEVPIEIVRPGGNPKKKSRQPPTLKLVSLEDIIRVDKYTPNQISYLSNFMFAPSFLLPYGFTWLILWSLHLDPRSFVSGLSALERPLTRAQSKWMSGDHPYFHPSPKLCEFVSRFFCLYLDIPFPTSIKGSKHIHDLFVVVMVKGFISPEDIEMAISGPSKESPLGTESKVDVENLAKNFFDVLKSNGPEMRPSEIANITRGLQKVTSILSKGITDGISSASPEVIGSVEMGAIGPDGKVFSVEDESVKITCMAIPDLASGMVRSGTTPPSSSSGTTPTLSSGMAPSGCKCQKCKLQDRLRRKIEVRKTSK